MMRTEPGLFSIAEVGGLLGTADVAEVAGATYRQVHYWTAQGYVECIRSAPGSGHVLRFADREVRVVTMLKLLTDLGIRPDAAAPLARELVMMGTATRGALTLTWRSPDEL